MATEIWIFSSSGYWPFTRQSTLLPDEPKYIWSRADKKALQVVGVLPSNRDISVTWEKMPIVIYQINGFKFDDRTERITLSARGEITDLVPEKTSHVTDLPNFY